MGVKELVIMGGATWVLLSVALGVFLWLWHR
jgi:hypothetical protein